MPRSQFSFGHKAIPVLSPTLFVKIPQEATHALIRLVTTTMVTNLDTDASVTKGYVFQEERGIANAAVNYFSKRSDLKPMLYSTEEMEKATDSFNEILVLGNWKGRQGTVYKGMLSDGSIMAIKKSNRVGEDQVGRFINEVLFLSQINHRNIVRLLGGCLEHEVPLLVYEFVSNGTLSYHLRNEKHVPKLSWENRLRTAGEVAGALAYLQSCASMAIYHRDIKSDNILLDENYRAVVSDLGLSSYSGWRHFGYLDPRYFRSGQFTDKSDVYPFGVVLAELLTGRGAISSSSSDEGLVFHFKASMKRNRLFEVLDTLVVDEGLEEEILAVAKLAQRCLNMIAKKRPVMKEVAAILDQLRRIRAKSAYYFHRSSRAILLISESACSYTNNTINEGS
ncbi:hypothetical protein RJ639_015164 [Escallonia herrerae]|uniref:Protein kinase domain-containing protein n=1 Tax=Escallonia herrerae TaxID=1293975 RepID=A0AA88VIV0_9ASTE|nr:hypothetical protein RJ639_015164 [Escallonia herrerae]